MKVHSTIEMESSNMYNVRSSLENKPPTSFLVIQILAYTVS